MADAVLTLDGLTKSFGALQVTRGVSLEVRPGEVHALIGPNGAGKTTLVSQIGGTLSPDAGHIHFAGTEITALSVAARARLGLARVFQISNVVGAFSARENTVLAALGKHGSASRFWRPVMADAGLAERADAALATVGLRARADVPAGMLSHGERRALELAMSLVQEPKLLLLDEPMAGTGREESEALTTLLAGLKGRIPMLLVEHDMTAVFALADRITVLIAGGVLVTGTPDDIRRNPDVRRAYIGEEAAV